MKHNMAWMTNRHWALLLAAVVAVALLVLFSVTALLPPATSTPVSQSSATASALPQPSNLLQNGSFEGGSLRPWYLRVRPGAAATVTLDTSTATDGAASVRADVTQSSTDWHAQLIQDVALMSGQTYNLSFWPKAMYNLSFWAKASTARTMMYALQSGVAPDYPVYYQNTVALTTNWQYFTVRFTYSASSDPNAFLGFHLAQATGSIWIDDVSLSTHFGTQPPGSALPSDSDCAARVPRSSWEPRPDNATANQTLPTTAQQAQIQAASWTGAGMEGATSDAYLHRVTGTFTGTSDEILRWVACKWGIDEDIVRAQAYQESDWYQSQRGDYASRSDNCPPGTFDGTGCYHSYGLLQIKYDHTPFTWPMSAQSTPFNVDYAYAWWRNCYEGHAAYLSQQTSTYHEGDLWGCIGFWYSGGWYDAGANNYISQVQQWYATKPWLQLGFQANTRRWRVGLRVVLHSLSDLTVAGGDRPVSSARGTSPRCSRGEHAC
jgi:Carbohydrate binding domain